MFHIFQILSECFNAKMKVVATVCDMSTVNMKVLKNLGVTSREPYFIHCGQEIVAILDPPHLLKCTRNLLLKHEVECTSDMHCNDDTVKGKHVQFHTFLGYIKKLMIKYKIIYIHIGFTYSNSMLLIVFRTHEYKVLSS